jgi:hypothetical protein
MRRGCDVLDATVFLGMHSEDAEIRQSCKSFFVERLSRTIVMSLEQVGLCDDVIWRHDRRLQDLYYPFMDTLHSVMDIRRVPYTEQDVRLALSDASWPTVCFSRRLTLAAAANGGSVLYSLDEALLAAPLGARIPPRSGAGAVFPPLLEDLYQRSLALLLPTARVAR